jgi:hypothetical protein
MTPRLNMETSRAEVEQWLDRLQVEVPTYIYQIMQAGVSLEQPPVIAARKWRHGRRPVAVLPLVDRVLYRGAIDSIAGRTIGWS